MQREQDERTGRKGRRGTSREGKNKEVKKGSDGRFKVTNSNA